jgi:hypothetical protein
MMLASFVAQVTTVRLLFDRQQSHHLAHHVVVCSMQFICTTSLAFVRYDFFDIILFIELRITHSAISSKKLFLD